MADPKFKQALMQAADGALADGTISKHDHETLAAVNANPNLTFATALQYLVQHTLGGVASTAGAIDWLSLINAIKTILPLIMQIVAMFKPTPAPIPPPAPNVTATAAPPHAVGSAPH